MSKKKCRLPLTLKGYFGLAVPDLDAAIKWFEQVLGFRLLAGPYFV
ncbi:VOC family protein [Peribacillus simplex]